MRGSTADGMPAWLDIPPLTAEQLLSQAENKRQSLLKHADEITADWRTELVLGEINEFNKRQLSEWMAYKRELKAMEITMASEITWPIQPEI
ncbi:phage tail assembly chaperone gp38 [Enterobacter asburiae]|nr:phage tail assembly chaperone gp38 [Enterobacter asburiae]